MIKQNIMISIFFYVDFITIRTSSLHQNNSFPDCSESQSHFHQAKWNIILS